MVAAPDLALRCRGLTKTYGRVVALDGLDIDLPRGEILALLGSSGCGKTTALRLIAGFEVPDAGTVEIGGRVVTSRDVNVPPEKRRAGLVFQDYALFPHMTVAKNVAYGLPSSASKDRINQLIRLVGLEGLERRMPHELSGGQQQRVALARTLATEPEVLLLDEPFSNLDARLRVQVRDEVRRIIRDTGTTAVFVTHDQEEAFVIADRIVVMRAGKAEQVGTASELYLHPQTSYVAGFVGVANFLPGRSDGVTATCDLGDVDVPAGIKGEVEVMLRPEDIILGGNGAAVDVVAEEFHGPFIFYRIRFASGVLATVRRAASAQLEVGSTVNAIMRPGSAVVFPAAAHVIDPALDEAAQAEGLAPLTALASPSTIMQPGLDHEGR